MVGGQVNYVTKCDKFYYKVWQFYYKVQRLLQSATEEGNNALLPSDIIRFAMLPAQRFSEILAGNSFIVGCHVTSKKPMGVRAVGKKF